MKIRLALSFILLACAAMLSNPAGAQESSAAAPSAKPEVKVAENQPTANIPAFKQPVLVTDIGQGNTARLIEVMLRRAGKVEFKSDPLAKASDLGEAKTLLIGVGGSTKGLGAAGLDANAETARMKALIDAAKKAGIPIIGVHMGGMPRRGELSDAFNRHVFEQSDLFILWEGGNEDGFFTRLNEAKKEPSAAPQLVIVEKKPDVGQKIEDCFASESKPEPAPGKKPETKEEKTAESKAK